MSTKPPKKPRRNHESGASKASSHGRPRPRVRNETNPKQPTDATHAAAQPSRAAGPGPHGRRRGQRPRGDPRRRRVPGGHRAPARGQEGPPGAAAAGRRRVCRDGRNGQRWEMGEETEVLVGSGHGRRPAAAPAGGAVRVRAAAVHGRGVHHPHGPVRCAAAGPRVRRHDRAARRAGRPAVAQLASCRAQHGVRGDAGDLHPVGRARRGAAARRRGSAHDVHLPRPARLLHAAAAAGGVPGVRDGLPRGECLLLPLLLRARRRRGDRGGRHAPRGPPRAGGPLRRAQPDAGGQAARVQGPLHHRPRRWRRRGPPLRHARRQVPRRQERRRREPLLQQLPQRSLLTVA